MNDDNMSSNSSATTVVVAQLEASSSSSSSGTEEEGQAKIHISTANDDVKRGEDEDARQLEQEQDEEGEATQTKTTFLSCLEEPDVIIAVGGIEFKEYRQVLRCWSGYFDVAFRSGMKETTTKRFEFPNRKPNEWEWIVSLMAPMSSTKITIEKLPIALDWFDELCCTRGMEECDRILYQERLAKLLVPVPSTPSSAMRNSSSIREEQASSFTATQLESVLEDLTMCLEFDLKQSKAKCLSIFRHVLMHCPKLFTTGTTHSKEILGQIVMLVKEHPVCHKALWSTLELYLPASISTEQRKVLLENDLLHEFIYLELSLYPFPRCCQSGTHEAGRNNNNNNNLRRGHTTTVGISRQQQQQQQQQRHPPPPQAGRGPRQLLLISESPDVSVNTTNAVCNSNEYQHGLSRRTWH